MNNKEILRQFDSVICEQIRIYKIPLFENTFENDSIFFTELAKDSQLDYNISADIKTTYEDLVYLTGILYSYRPHINNPQKEKISYNSKSFSTYHQNLYDSLYSMYVSCCYEKLYNFWDRIGDKLAQHYSNEFPNPRNIMYANVIDKLSSRGISGENFEWLTNFRNSDFKDFNEKRREIVHYAHFETKYKESFFKNYKSPEIVDNLWHEKLSHPDFFKKHIDLAVIGMNKAFSLINE